MADTTIKENGLPVHASEAAAAFAARYLRMVTDILTGDSEVIKNDDILWQLKNVEGLLIALAGKQALVPLAEDYICSFDGGGQAKISGFTAGKAYFTTPAELDAIVYDGFYTCGDEAVDFPPMGYIVAADIRNTKEIFFTSTGLWYRQYTDTGWSLPRYIGGGFDNITLAYADAAAMIAASQLSPGAKYKITGHGQDLGIIVAAESPTSFETRGIRIGIIPAHFSAGTYGAYTWGGTWHAEMADPGEDTYYVYCGMVWKALSGNVGTASAWSLDATNWLLIDPQTNIPTFYTTQTFTVDFKFAATDTATWPFGFIMRQINQNNIELGDIIEPVDGFDIDYNDWSFNIDPPNYSFFNVKATRLYNNIGKAPIYNVDIEGKIYENNLNSTNGIHRIFGSGNLRLNNIGLNGGAGNLYNTFLSNGNLTSCDIDGVFSATIDNETLTGTISTYGGTNSIKLVGARKVSSAFIIGTGTFTVPTGATYSLPTVVTGCAMTVDRENGITVDTDDRLFVVQYTGWYRLHMTTSATVSAACIAECMAYKNSTTPIPQWYNKKKYNTTDSWQTTTLPDYPVYLEAGDIISIMYKHDNVGTITVSLGQINKALDYDN